MTPHILLWLMLIPKICLTMICDIIHVEHFYGITCNITFIHWQIELRFHPICFFVLLYKLRSTKPKFCFLLLELWNKPFFNLFTPFLSYVSLYMSSSNEKTKLQFLESKPSKCHLRNNIAYLFHCFMIQPRHESLACPSEPF